MKYQFKNLCVSGSRAFRLIWILSLFLFLQQPVCAQFGLAILPNTTQAEAEAMIQNIFISGDVEVSNIHYTGYPQASGEFIGVTGVGFNQGMILTSGLATIALGPNNSGGAGNSNGAAGDPDLALLAGVSSYNACVLSFDFVPKTEKIKFRYVFGSEEYPEYVDQFNDMFGFFLSGPGISGPYSNNAINIALIPGTSTPVSINTVNIEDNNQYFVANSPTVVNNIIQYDGYTTPLYAEYTVVPSQTYKIKMAISDIADPAYDSGLFFEANSFTDQDATAINSRPEDIRLSISPNPGSGLLRLNVQSAASQPSRVVVLNALGQQVIDQVVSPNTEAVLDLQQQSGGMYTLIVRQGDQVSRRKLIISK